MEETKVETPAKESKKRENSPEFKALISSLENEQNVEKKIEKIIAFMKEAIDIKNSRFFDFWEARKICLPLFKEKGDRSHPGKLFTEFLNLSAEARALREARDEKSAFALEQIELAIQGLEKETSHLDELLEKLPAKELPKSSATANNADFYTALQREASLLSTFTSRIASLRKEILQTSMRMKKKNELLERISTSGEKVYPKRKELSQQISEKFLSDVEAFVSANFEKALPQGSQLFALRDEIKVLQQMAKELTLSAKAFKVVREKLSEAWEKIKAQEKERKKEFAEKKEKQKAAFSGLTQKIDEFAKFCAEGETPENRQAIQEQERAIKSEISKTAARKDERAPLFKALEDAMEPVLKMRRAKEEEENKRRAEAESSKKRQVEEVKVGVASLLHEVETLEPSLAEERADVLEKTIKQVDMSSVEKQLLLAQCRRVRERIGVKARKALANSSDSHKRLEEWYSHLDKLEEEKKEAKDEIERLRKASGSSGLDFEKAILYQELLEEEKKRLLGIAQSIEEIEREISAIEEKE